MLVAVSGGLAHTAAYQQKRYRAMSLGGSSY
jgi:hypothetical protein